MRKNVEPMPAKRALITASASGIGAATARALSTEGYEVVVSDIDADAGAALAAEIGGRFVACDLAKADQIEALVAEAGPVSVLVNNGGVSRAHRAPSPPSRPKSGTPPSRSTSRPCSSPAGSSCRR